jgi:hypothetical protein
LLLCAAKACSDAVSIASAETLMMTAFLITPSNLCSPVTWATSAQSMRDTRVDPGLGNMIAITILRF